jgi:hypothetical protein
VVSAIFSADGFVFLPVFLQQLHKENRRVFVFRHGGVQTMEKWGGSSK